VKIYVFFCVVAANVSLAATTRSLNVRPSSVTKRLHHLEDKLKLKLVNRQARKIFLTDEGQLLLARAKVVLTELDDLHHVILNQRDDVTGKLKIFAPLSFGNQYIAPLVGKFQSEHPNLTIDLKLSDNPNSENRQNADIIIHICELKDSSLKMTLLANIKRVICASPTYISKYGQPTSVPQLRQQRCIALRENSEDVTMWRFNHVKTGKSESIRINPELASNDGRTIKQWALDRYGIIIRPEWNVAKEINNGQLDSVPKEYKLADANIVALLSSDHVRRSAKTIKFLDYLKDNLFHSPWRMTNEN